MNETRVFFVVDIEDKNEEIFETLEQAERYRKRATDNDKASVIYVAIVKNAYLDKNTWSYEDKADTFTFIKDINA